MSLTSLANEEVARARPRYQIPKGLSVGVVASRGRIRDFPRRDEAEGATPGQPAASGVLDALSRYIPVEIVTLYIAALSALPALTETFASVSDVRLYWFFAALTPVLFLLVVAGKRRRTGLSALPALRHWPWWKLLASTIAFIVWALAVPTTPYLAGPAGKVVAAFGALLVSTFLTLLEPIFDPSDPDGPPLGGDIRIYEKEGPDDTLRNQPL